MLIDNHNPRSSRSFSGRPRQQDHAFPAVSRSRSGSALPYNDRPQGHAFPLILYLSCNSAEGRFRLRISAMREEICLARP
jgi:hypothetical protein